ncbi:MAG: acyltransferase [Lachnospiraceae bacterium]|nr:acyltransferase [Lachnospiraceae bacterium]
MIRKETGRIFRGIAILVVIASHYAEWMYVTPVHPNAAHAVSTWGPMGVDVFFLLSGYGLYVSQKKGGVDFCFIKNRLLGAYLPYLLLVFLINIYSGFWKEVNAERILTYLTASDYWYMNVLLVFYILFMLCFRFGKRLRIPLFSIALIAYSVYLFKSGHRDFWTLSNPSFLLGVYAGVAEEHIPAFSTRKSKVVLLLCGCVGCALAFMWMQKLGGSGLEESYVAELVLNLFLAIFIFALMALLPCFQPLLLGVLGECSLFIYLLHTVAFYAIILKLPEHWPYAQSAMITAALTLLMAVFIGKVYYMVSGRLSHHEKK